MALMRNCIQSINMTKLRFFASTGTSRCQSTSSLNKSFGFLRLMWVGLCVVLVGCENNASMSTDVYERYVIETLKGDPQRGTGVGVLLAATMGDLDCQGPLCTDRVRFQYLNEEVPDRRVLVADYIGKVCQREDVLPPASHQQNHEAICESLDDFFKILDRTTLHASNAVRLSAAQAIEGTQQLLEAFSERLAQEREQLLTVKNSLENVTWLRSTL